ncbi:MAG TPA: hypothetical protein V6C86_24250 [Oculatellaceae cyanobacterium]
MVSHQCDIHRIHSLQYCAHDVPLIHSVMMQEPQAVRSQRPGMDGGTAMDGGIQ